MLAWGGGTAQAGEGTELIVVGTHVVGELRTGDEERRFQAAADRLSDFRVVGPHEVQSRLRGRGGRLVDEALQARGRELLSEGRVLFEHADLESAQDRIVDAVSILERAMAGSSDGRHLIDALLVQGNIGLAMGNMDAARAAYKRVLQLDSVRVLDPVHHPPKVIDLYTRVRDAVLAVPFGTLEITSVDPGATVVVDGRVRGKGSVTLRDMVPGFHHVLVTGSNGHRDYWRVEVRAKQQVTLEAQLDRFFIAEPAETDEERADQASRLYRALGDQVTEGLVLMGGQVGLEEVGLQLYEPRTGNFSRVLRGDVGADPVQSMSILLSELSLLRSPQGTLASDAVSTDQIPLDVGMNPTLARVLFAPADGDTVAAGVSRTPSPVPWPIWAGIGSVVVGGVLAAVLVRPGPTDTKEKRIPNETGTVVVRF